MDTSMPVFEIGDWVILLSFPDWGPAWVAKRSSFTAGLMRYEIVFGDGFRMWAAPEKIKRAGLEATDAE